MCSFNLCLVYNRFNVFKKKCLIIKLVIFRCASKGLHVIEANRSAITAALVEVFDLKVEQAEKLFLEVLQCVRKRNLVSIFI